MVKRFAIVFVIAVLAFMWLPSTSSASSSGTIRDVNNQGVAGAFVMLFDQGANVIGGAYPTGADGSFVFSAPPGFTVPLPDATVDDLDGFVIQQPAVNYGPEPDLLGIYQHQPRAYLKPPNTPVDIVLPEASSFILKGNKLDGSLMRWGDFVSGGPGTEGSQFMYLTNLDEEMQPAVNWPTYDDWARQAPQNGAREYGLPSLVVDSRNAGRYSISAMYWNVKDYGKLCLRADNAGAGFELPAAGAAVVIDLNFELARTAVTDLERRQAFFEEHITDEDIDALIAGVQAVVNVDDRLRDALQLRDRLELKAARNSIDAVRKGTLEVTARDVNLRPVPGCSVTIDQTSHDFLFGANGGGMSEPPQALWQKIAEAGFELCPLLPAWGFTEQTDPPYDYWGKEAIEATFGVQKIIDAGFKLKFTGSVWMQGSAALGILPPRTASMTLQEIQDGNLHNQAHLLSDFSDDPIIWEVMNEPATTNTVGMPREQMADLMNDSALQIKAANANMNTLINSPSEFDFGFRYQSYRLDGATPPDDNLDLDGYKTTFSDFLKQASTTIGNLDSIDTIGLQFYPGAHVSPTYGEGEAPAFTPSWLVDAAERYNSLFDKPVHITELSFPSSYDVGTWHSGYWRQPWDEATQADYTESVYTMMFANPVVHSVLWWDTPDDGAFVVSGGLVRSDLSEKPSYQRIQALVASWTTSDEQADTRPTGQATLSGFGGDYTVSVVGPDGHTENRTAHIDERDSNSLVVDGFTALPQITGLSPERKTAGADGFTLVVDGTDFEAGSKVHWSGVERPTTFVSPTRVTATIPESDIAHAGTASVTVVNDSGESNSRVFTVDPAPEPPEPPPPPPDPPPAPTTTPAWYLAEGTSDYGFDTYINIENPNATAVTARITYMTAAGPVARDDVRLPAMSQTTINPRDDIGVKDFSTRVVCAEGKTIVVDRRMIWVGAGAPSQEGTSSVGITAPARTWYLPEGSSKWGFETWLLIQNPNSADASCTVTYMTEDAGPLEFTKTVKANSRASFDMGTDIGQRDASIRVESNRPVIPERAMYRNSRREGHVSTGTTTPSVDYYLAEGTTDWGFTTYVLVQNPNESANDVLVTYMTREGAVAQPTVTISANSRRTIRVNDALPGKDMSTRVQGSMPLIAERAMYWGASSPLGEACHDSIGMEAPHKVFYLPDGETQGSYETWTLVQNPNASPVAVEVSYLPAGGGEVKTVRATVPANSRMTFNMEDLVPEGRAAIMVTSKTDGKKIMCERAMYWNSRGAGTDTIGGYSD